MLRRRSSPAIRDDNTYSNTPPHNRAEYQRRNHFPSPAQHTYNNDFNAHMVFHQNTTLLRSHNPPRRPEERAEERHLSAVYISQIRRTALKGELERVEKLHQRRKVQAFKKGIEENMWRDWVVRVKMFTTLLEKGEPHDNFVRDMAFAPFYRDDGHDLLADAAPFALFLRKGWEEGSLEVALAMSRVRHAVVETRT